MSKRLTTERLEVIRKRAGSATGGPWTVAYTTVDNFILDSVDWDVLGNPNQDGNAEFIAKAREDVPALLAEVEQLRSLLLKAYQYGNTAESYQNDENNREVYEYLYGGDDE